VEQTTWSAWQALHPALPGRVADAEQGDLADMIQPWFWNAVQGDRLGSLALPVFDMGFMSSPRTASLLLQKTLGFTGKNLDGQIGNITIAAIPSDATLLQPFYRTCQNYFSSLAGWKTFGTGWTRRNFARTRLAQQWELGNG
jgi:lysozyme family protein